MDGDSTFFRHPDINVPRYLKSSWGANAIQRSESLDDETVDSCKLPPPEAHVDAEEVKREAQTLASLAIMRLSWQQH